MKKISFIVPAYNAQEYIRNCVEQILKIAYQSIELIVVDDGSTDDTLSILSEIIDERLYIISQKNQGVSAARNAGLQHATGDYITFVDVDDLVLSEPYGMLLDKLVFDKDIYMFAYETRKGKKIKQVELPLEPGVYDSSAARRMCERLYDVQFSKNYTSEYFGGKIYQYLFRRSFLMDNNIVFPEGVHFAEDCVFCCTCYDKVQQFEVLSECLYQYVVYSSSVSHRYRDDFWKELILSYEKSCENIQREVGDKSRVYFFYACTVIRRIVKHFSRQECRLAYLKLRGLVHDVAFQEALQNLEYDNWTKQEKVIIMLCRRKMYRALFWFMKFNNRWKIMK